MSVFRTAEESGMNRILTVLVSALCLAGCFSSASEAPVAWIIDADTDLAVSAVSVAAPYDGLRLVVLRPDGSVAFDGHNSFSSRPGALIRAAVRVDFAAPPLFVRRLALDCTQKGTRKAVVDLAFGGTAEAPLLRASGSADASDGNYTRAFSEAFVKAREGLRQTAGN